MNIMGRRLPYTDWELRQKKPFPHWREGSGLPVSWTASVRAGRFMGKGRKVLEKIINRETKLYILFGIMTTIVNFGSYIVFDKFLGEDYYLVSNIFSFIIATIFAFITNKLFVFQSMVWEWQIVMKELISFVVARIGTFVIIEEMGLWILVYFLKVNKVQILFLNGTLLAKIALSIFAVLLNYILSKFLIFKKG